MYKLPHNPYLWLLRICLRCSEISGSPKMSQGSIIPCYIHKCILYKILIQILIITVISLILKDKNVFNRNHSWDSHTIRSLTQVFNDGRKMKNLLCPWWQCWHSMSYAFLFLKSELILCEVHPLWFYYPQ